VNVICRGPENGAIVETKISEPFQLVLLNWQQDELM